MFSLVDNDARVRTPSAVDLLQGTHLKVREQVDELVEKGDVRNVIVSNGRRGCTYKEFLACNPKEYDGKGGVVVYTCWIEKMESIRTLGREVAVGMSWDNFKVLMREEFCPSNEMQKLETELWNHTMVGAGHAMYTDRFHELASKNGSIKKNPEKRGNGGNLVRIGIEPSDLGFSYEIEIDSGQLVKLIKVLRDVN
ncbi:reverse transcriptase domain-containing protein [Tanacetum coccineum]